MKNLLYLFLISVLASCSQAQQSKQKIVVCEKENGCQSSEILNSRIDIDRILEKSNFMTTAGEGAILVVENCASKIEQNLSVQQIHKSYGGVGEPEQIRNFDLENYIKLKGCKSCSNSTKKLSFIVNSPEHNGSGYSYINFKLREAYMPNAAFQQFMAGQEGASSIVVDQFIRDYELVTYTIAEGQKYVHKMPLGLSMFSNETDELNEQRFKNEFKKTGQTKPHFVAGFEQTEYAGRDDEGKQLKFWLVPANDVCMPSGKFDMVSLYNIGYISVDGITYLITEISNPDFNIQVVNVEEGSYNFNPAGYQSY